MRTLTRVALAAHLVLAVANAQTASQPVAQADRVSDAPATGARVAIPGHVPAWAAAANDAGPVPPATSLRLTFVLTRSADRQAAFEQLLADQQNPSSPRFHQWLSPQQVGELYGPTPHDLAALTTWLAASGLTLRELTPSRTFVAVDASPSAASAALGTQFRLFNVKGAPHIAVTAEPSVPSALAPIVRSIKGLSDSLDEPMNQHHPVQLQPAATPESPRFTNGAAHYVTPKDFATIFDINPAYTAGYTGTGQHAAVIGRSRVVSTDVTEYEANTGLASNLPNTIIPPTGVDPGVTQNGDEGEALLDVDRIIGVAPNVTVDLIVSLSGSGGGIDTAAQYNVQTLLDPVMNISFGACEVYNGPSGVQYWDSLFAQAAAEGISVFVSSADSAAATCDAQFGVPPAYQFLSVNYICSSSYDTCLGGTEFADTASPSTYWSSANGTGLSSALSYIPEGAWNDPTEVVSGVTEYVAQGSGGGASIYVTKPAWQTGTGVPADGARDLPDLAFPASAHDGYYGCYASNGGNCATGYFEYFAGTSAAAPSMAGITVLLNQKSGGRQGNLNPLLYRLASTPGVFHDATPASSGVSGCTVSVPSMCNNSVPSPTGLTGGLAGYALTNGYDQATGNGSLDVYNFLVAATASTGTTKAPTGLSLSATALTTQNNTSVTFTASLTSSGNTNIGTPTGTVQFYVNTTASGTPVALSGGKAVIIIPFTAAGNDLISAIYSGDTNYATSTAAGVPLTVVGATPVVTLNLSPNPTTTLSPVAATATVKQSSGTTVPTGLVRFYDNYLGYFATVPLVNGTATAPAQLFSNAGTHELLASYLGDTVYAAVYTPYSTLTVTAATPTITWPTPAPIASGTALTSAQLDATANVAGTFVYTPATGAILAAGNQTLSVTFTPTDTIDYTTASTTVTLVVQNADFSLAVTPSATILNAGQSATFTATLTPIGGFNQTVTFNCSGLPANASCSFNPTSIILSGGPASSALQIYTNVAALDPPVLFPRPFGVTLALAVLFLPFTARRRRKTLWTALSALTLAILLGTAGGCGGGSSGSSSSAPKTPDGTYTVTVSATAGSATHTVPLTVTVNN